MNITGKLGKLICLNALLTLMIPGIGVSAAELKSVFSSPEKVSWKAYPYNLKSPKTISNEFGSGFQFFCNFSRVDPKYPRCYWDGKFTPVDFSKATTIVMKAHIKNAASIQRIAFYLNNGKTWFLSRSVAGVHEGVNTLVFQLADYRPDGKPHIKPKKSELKQIKMIRFNVFSGDTKPSTITLYNISTSVKKIEPGEMSLFEPPARDKNLIRKERFDKDGNLLENRVILDESGNFLKRGIDKVINDISRAGFNVYMPCVWHGRGALYRSSSTVVEPKFSKFFKSTDRMAELIKKAHAKNIQVHAWFCVTLRGVPDPHPEFTTKGVPRRAYDLQDPAYRDFIVKEIISFAKKYNVDGINLDYIRTMGTSFSKIASERYRKKYNADISELKNSPMSTKVKKRFLEWQNDAVSDIVQRVRAGLKEVRLGIALTICGGLLPKPELHDQGRNGWLWAEKDLIDTAYTMDYSWTPNFNNFDKKRRLTSCPGKFALMLANYDMKGEKIISRNPEQVAPLIDYALRKFPESGIALYWYESLNDEQVKKLRTGIFRKKARASWNKKY
jgi:Glycosyl hydrolase-like 10